MDYTRELRFCSLCGTMFTIHHGSTQSLCGPCLEHHPDIPKTQRRLGAALHSLVRADPSLAEEEVPGE